MTDELFSDLYAASNRLQSAWHILLDAGDKEIAQLVYRANLQVVEAIGRLVKEWSVEQRSEEVS